MSLINEIKKSVTDWKVLLVDFGVDESLLTKKGSACPVCGGKDRFTWDGKYNGSGYCRHCGHMDAIKIIQETNGYAFSETLHRLAMHMGIDSYEEPAEAVRAREYKKETEQYLAAIRFHYLMMNSSCSKINMDYDKHSRAMKIIRDYRQKHPDYMIRVGL